MKLFFKNEIIEFYCSADHYGVIPEPVPAYKMMPEWFKKISPEVDDARDMFGSKLLTAKKCMPLLDAMSTGFIMPLFGDVNVRSSKDNKFIEVGNGNLLGNVIEFHSLNQLGGSTSPTYPGPAIKFINHWVIKTAPGYSTLFIPPINHMEDRFTCLGGLVDTDAYPKQVNFPAVWHKAGYDGLVKAGTPLVTVIPFKRKDMPRRATTRVITEKEQDTINKIHKKQGSRLNVYTNELRDKRKTDD